MILPGFTRGIEPDPRMGEYTNRNTVGIYVTSAELGYRLEPGQVFRIDGKWSKNYLQGSVEDKTFLMEIADFDFYMKLGILTKPSIWQRIVKWWVNNEYW